MKSVLIVGFGVVGQLLYKELNSLHPDIVDKYKYSVSTKDVDKRYDFAFICVDTPNNENGVCDVTEVKNAIEENDASIYVIKSTVLPGTTESIVTNLGKQVIFSPEYYGGTQHCNNFKFDFTVLGGNRDWCVQTQQLLQNVYDARHEFRITDSKTAELLKYMVNTNLAVRVSFCVQFFEIAESYGVEYEELRELFLLDPRTNPAHTFVYRDHPYWESHCLSKDVPAIADVNDARFLDALISYNDYCKGNL